MSEPERKSDDELKAMVRENIRGELYITNAPEHVINSFGMLASAVLENFDRESIGALYEYMDKAGPRSINGDPFFLSCHVMHIEDFRKFIQFRKNMIAMMEAI